MLSYLLGTLLRARYLHSRLGRGYPKTQRLARNLRTRLEPGYVRAWVPFSRWIIPRPRYSVNLSTSSLPGLPTAFLQINPTGAIKPDALSFQSRALLVKSCRRSNADLAARVDDAMPGHLVGTDAHRPADRPRTMRHPKRPRDLSVRDDAATGDAADERVDAGEECGSMGVWGFHSEQ